MGLKLLLSFVIEKNMYKKQRVTFLKITLEHYRNF